MDNRSRTSRYPKTEYQNEREYINFRSVNNTALQPEYLPVEPKRRVEQRPKPTLVPQQRPKPKSKTAKRAKLILSVLAITACACCLLVRNAQVYENNRKIQALGKEIDANTILVNNVKKDLASEVDITRYLEIAQTDLHMDYPQTNQIYALEVAPANDAGEELTQIQKSSNIFDSVLDWFNSLERRS